MLPLFGYGNLLFILNEFHLRHHQSVRLFILIAYDKLAPTFHHDAQKAVRLLVKVNYLAPGTAMGNFRKLLFRIGQHLTAVGNHDHTKAGAIAQAEFDHIQIACLENLQGQTTARKQNQR